MLSFFQRDLPAMGSVHYRGTLPPRAEEYSFLEAARVSLKPMNPGSALHWHLKMTHQEWGEAELMAPRELPAPPPFLIDLVTNLSRAEKEAAKAAGTCVALRAAGRKKNILKDRKNFLRWLRAVMADDAVFASDAASLTFWSPAGLDEELAHDADLDISSLYCIHAVKREDGQGCDWLHTHGLAEIGGFDFDILNPSDDVLRGPGSDAVRAVAYAIAEGLVRPDTRDFTIAHPGGKVSFMPAADFDRRAPRAEAALRDGDPGHIKNRAVLCDVSKGFLGLGGGVRASRFLQGPVSQGSLIAFSTAATEMMAQRARRTLGVLQRLMQEFAEFSFPTIAKIGYESDRGGREHLWFEVHGVGRDGIDATLESSPYDIAAMTKGVRGLHAVEKLTDWTMITPAGWITPRGMAAARVVRENKDEIRRAMSARGGEG